MHATGRYDKVPPEERLVPESEDPWLHLQLAMQLKWPGSRQAARVSSLHLEAAEKLLTCPDIQGFRMAQLGEWRSIRSASSEPVMF